MPVQAAIIVTFTAESVADVEAVVAELNAPEGANVSASVTEQVAGGVVEAGELVALEVAGSSPPDNGEAPAE